jgi:chromosome segregation ATPase
MKVLLPLTLILASCAVPDAGKRMRGVIAPPRKPYIENRVIDVQDATADVEEANRALKAKVVRLSAATSEASSAASRASSEADRLALQKAATEEELLNLSVIMKDVAARNMFLEESSKELEAKIVEQEEHIVVLSQKVMTARAAAAEKDLQIVGLYDQIAAANVIIAEADEAAGDSAPGETGQHDIAAIATK